MSVYAETFGHFSCTDMAHQAMGTIIPQANPVNWQGSYVAMAIVWQTLSHAHSLH